MPVKTPASNLKAKSPSKVIQKNVDKDWGNQTGYQTPQSALADKHTKTPYPVNGSGGKQ